MMIMLALFYSHQDKGRVYIAVIHYASDAAGDDITRAFGRTSSSSNPKPCVATMWRWPWKCSATTRT